MPLGASLPAREKPDGSRRAATIEINFAVPLGMSVDELREQEAACFSTGEYNNTRPKGKPALVTVNRLSCRNGFVF